MECLRGGWARGTIFLWNTNLVTFTNGLNTAGLFSFEIVLAHSMTLGFSKKHSQNSGWILILYLSGSITSELNLNLLNNLVCGMLLQ